jgi:hypothetical protein
VRRLAGQDQGARRRVVGEPLELALPAQTGVGERVRNAGAVGSFAGLVQLAGGGEHEDPPVHDGETLEIAEHGRRQGESLHDRSAAHVHLEDDAGLILHRQQPSVVRERQIRDLAQYLGQPRLRGGTGAHVIAVESGGCARRRRAGEGDRQETEARETNAHANAPRASAAKNINRSCALTAAVPNDAWWPSRCW